MYILFLHNVLPAVLRVIAISTLYNIKSDFPILIIVLRYISAGHVQTGTVLLGNTASTCAVSVSVNTPTT